jgi:signal transduction histidine kinase
MDTFDRITNALQAFTVLGLLITCILLALTLRHQSKRIDRLENRMNRDGRIGS